MAGPLVRAVFVVMTSLLVSTAVASDIDVELIDEGYDFLPNMVRSAPSPITHDSSGTHLRPTPQGRPRRNPLQRFVTAVVSEKEARNEKIKLKHQAERFSKRHVAEVEKLEAEKQREATQQAQMRAMKLELARVEAAKKRDEARAKKQEAAEVSRRAKAEAKALAAASALAAKAEHATKLAPAAPMAQGQAPALKVVKRVQAKLAAAAKPPPLDGVSDDGMKITRLENIIPAEESHVVYNVAAAEQSAEKHEDRLLERAAERFEHTELGASNDEVQVPAPAKTEVFLKRDVFERAVAQSELKHYQAEVNKEELRADQTLNPATRLRAQERARLGEAVAKAASQYIEKEFPHESLVLLEVPPSTGSPLAAQLAEMNQLSAELAKTISEKTARLAAVRKRVLPLETAVHTLHSDLVAVRRASQNLDESAMLMRNEEMGEGGPTEREHSPKDTTVLMDVSSPQDANELSKMEVEEKALEGEVNGLGEEQDRLSKDEKSKAAAAKAKAAAAKAKLVHQNALKEKNAKVHKNQAKAAALKQRSAQMYSAKLLAQEAKRELHSKLTEIRDNDESQLKQALLEIQDKKKALRTSIGEANNLRAALEDDTELGESMDSRHAQEQLKQVASKQQAIESTGEHLGRQTQVLRSELQEIRGYNSGVVELTKSLLKKVHLGGTNDQKLLSAAGSASMKLRLQLANLKQLNSKAAQMDGALGAMENFVGSATMVTHSSRAKMVQVFENYRQLRRGYAEESSRVHFDRSFKEDNELGESLHKGKAAVKLKPPRLVDEGEVDIGESDQANDKVDGMSKTPIQAQMDWESRQLVNAKSRLAQIKLDEPTLLAKQTHLDRVEMTKQLANAQASLTTLAERFQATAASISPSIVDEQTLDYAKAEQEDSARVYSEQLVQMQRGLQDADNKNKEAYDNVGDALTQMREITGGR